MRAVLSHEHVLKCPLGSAVTGTTVSKGPLSKPIICIYRRPLGGDVLWEKRQPQNIWPHGNRQWQVFFCITKLEDQYTFTGIHTTVQKQSKVMTCSMTLNFTPMSCTIKARHDIKAWLCHLQSEDTFLRVPWPYHSPTPRPPPRCALRYGFLCVPKFSWWWKIVAHSMSKTPNRATSSQLPRSLREFKSFYKFFRGLWIISSQIKWQLF